jgi:hypothetical protein
VCVCVDRYVELEHYRNNNLFRANLVLITYVNTMLGSFHAEVLLLYVVMSIPIYRYMYTTDSSTDLDQLRHKPTAVFFRQSVTRLISLFVYVSLP